jgi:hypothetical protein
MKFSFVELSCRIQLDRKNFRQFRTLSLYYNNNNNNRLYFSPKKKKNKDNTSQNKKVSY